MRLNKRVLKALDIVAYMAERYVMVPASYLVSPGEIERTFALKPESVRKLMEPLVHAGVVKVSRKSHAEERWYSLSRSPQNISVSLIIKGLAPDDYDSETENALHSISELSASVARDLEQAAKGVFDRPLTDFVDLAAGAKADEEVEGSDDLQEDDDLKD